jgi:hypothetical protein
MWRHVAVKFVPGIEGRKLTVHDPKVVLEGPGKQKTLEV